MTSNQSPQDSTVMQSVGNYKTVWGLYYINNSRTEGYSLFFNTYEQALNARYEAPQVGTCFIIQQIYELGD